MTCWAGAGALEVAELGAFDARVPLDFGELYEDGVPLACPLLIAREVDGIPDPEITAEPEAPVLDDKGRLDCA